MTRRLLPASRAARVWRWRNPRPTSHGRAMLLREGYSGKREAA